MATSVSEKLKIKKGFTLLPLNAPPEFKKGLQGLPAGVKIIASGKDYNQVHWFVKDKAQMEKELNKLLQLVHSDVVCWVYFPKGTSKMQTDLTRDKGWDKLLKHHELKRISLVSFDNIWSTFAFRMKMEADKKKETIPKERPILDYVDPKTKKVSLPDDLVSAFKKNKKQYDFFNTLSFTNKKEYIGWIVTAKREETRNERVKGTIDRLAKGWKNPGNI